VRRGLLHKRRPGGFAPLMRAWLDWVDGWDVDCAHRPGLFVSRWQALREQDGRAPPLRSPVLPGCAGAVAVRVLDIFSNEHILILPCPAGGEAERDT
jgi:hypothetical protein